MPEERSKISDPLFKEKMVGLGMMVWSLITDIAVLPRKYTAYARKTVTYPDGKGGKSAIEIIVARKEMADFMEEAAVRKFTVTDLHIPGGDTKPS